MLGPTGVGKTELAKSLAEFPVLMMQTLYCGWICLNIWKNMLSLA